MKKSFPNHVICGYASIKNNIKEVENKNLIKLVKNSKDELIYFSRSKIPAYKNEDSKKVYYKQVCVYAFSRSQLKKFYKTKKSSVEKAEDIELLRFLELGIKIKLCKISPTIAVDTPQDIKKVERFLRKWKQY